MSYSRWGSSRWYTYWTVYCRECNKCECNIRDHQSFEIDCCLDFTYRELKDDIDACIEKVKMFKVDRDIFAFNYECISEADILELKSYMLRFIEDVEDSEELID